MAYKFEDKFVHFRWDDELKGKMVFFADSIKDLEENVCTGSEEMKILDGRIPNSDYPLVVGRSSWKFVYYDPNYDIKIAYEEGKTIQYKAKDTGRWCDWDNSLGKCPFLDDVEYRIKPEAKRVTYYVPLLHA